MQKGVLLSAQHARLVVDVQVRFVVAERRWLDSDATQQRWVLILGHVTVFCISHRVAGVFTAELLRHHDSDWPGQ